MSLFPTLSLTRRLCWRLVVFAAASAGAVAAEKQAFDLPADFAEKSLRRFSTQSGVALVFPSEIARGARTQAVQGAFTPREALDRLLTNSGLVATENKKTGAIAIVAAAPAGVPSGEPVSEAKPSPDA